MEVDGLQLISYDLFNLENFVNKVCIPEHDRGQDKLAFQFHGSGDGEISLYLRRCG